jgi:hypothetical protein
VYDLLIEKAPEEIHHSLRIALVEDNHVHVSAADFFQSV